MTAGNRSISDILQDIIHNVQEIVRSEVRLAKRELRDEVANAKAAWLLLVVGGLSAIFAVLFLLLMSVYALSTVMPKWAAASIVAGALAMIATATLGVGIKRLKQLRLPELPERIIDRM
ncbi:MAG: phage holin family protein [Bryobacteraceae bacterium]